MQFHSFMLSEDGSRVTATAQGHADEVVTKFREVCQLVFIDKGAWRITRVHGECFPEMRLDSEMTWSLRAERKVDDDLRMMGCDREKA